MPNNIPSYRDVFTFLKRANNVSDFKAVGNDIQFRATKFAVDGINRKIKPAGLTVTHVKDDVYSVPRGLDKWMKVPDLKEANNITEEIDSKDKHKYADIVEKY